ncbi:phosphonate C-P lyase system protein PhnH [Pseudoruegeria sp. SK021]|uniref:phosphonate C-P lyase system protein PhnH n=1 Tax=Pseudoruegeria sp. SK021 TaxID=1933035 RepID=UPI000A259BC6|nr:phosphonate C-P lyase system protein PhnH [Pseudoruegeria sp. SK021]OSP55938.1 phosphonate C-P lyase system protein PhnH [Pseudoruegeria sp. SK021]
MQTQSLDGGFHNAPIEAAYAFRAVMRAMACPGTIVTLAGAEPPAPLSRAAGVVVLTLCDPETPVYLAPSRNTAAIRDWITFHTGAPLVAADRAAFGLGLWSELGQGGFPLGTAEYPDRSATLIVELPQLAAAGATLQGPGIETSAELSLPEIAAFQANARLFPRGLDYLFTCGDRLAGLPRTTKVR